jgi:cystathionine beta-lyase
MVDTAYGPTRTFCRTHLPRFGVSTTFYDPAVGGGITALFQPNTKVVFVESPGSLTFEVQDLPAIADAAHRAGITVVIDNTWATPYYLPALALGADVSCVAATKFIGGHSDVMVGTVTTKDVDLYRRIRGFVAEQGVAVSPDDAYLALRGLRTLGIRLERHWRSALRVAEWLRGRPEVRRVLYPPLPDDPGHALWTRDFRGATSLFGVVLEPVSRPALTAFLDGLELFGMGASFGGFESLIIPVTLGRSRTATTWTEPGPLLRLHVGLEDPADLIADLDQGLARLGAA